MIYSGPYKDIFRRSQIVLNQTACSEVNFRCFESVACGAALLMERCGHGLEELLVPGEHILPLYTRNDWREAAAIASRALAEPEKLAEMAAHGRRHVLANHLAWHRGQVVHDVMAGLIREDAPKRRLERLDFRRKFLAASYAMLGYELTGRVDSAYVEYCYTMSSATQTLAAP